MTKHYKVKATVHEIHKLENCVVIIAYIDHKKKYVTLCMDPNEYRTANLNDGAKLEIMMDRKTGKPQKVLHIKKVPLMLLQEKDPDEPYDCKHEYV